MTDLDILANAINTLGTISVPVELVERITMPIAKVRNDLTVLYQAIAQAKANAKKVEEEAAAKAAKAAVEEPQLAEEDFTPEEIDQNGSEQ